MIFLLVTVSAAAATTCLGVALLRSWLERRKILDVPNTRSQHVTPTPRGGGLVIVLVCALGLAAIVLLYGGVSQMHRFAGVAIGAVLIAFVSWRDDVRSSPPAIRLAVHVAAALLVLATAGWWRAFSVPGLSEIPLPGLIGPAVTLLWLVGLTSAYNFMDGIDGIAGAQAVVGGAAWATLGALTGDVLVSGAGALLAGASLGFLWHNWHPARIFMGDIGAATIGFLFAAFAVAAVHDAPFSAVAGVLVVWPFVFDTSLTFVRRAVRGENVFTPHRSHLYQRLVLARTSQEAVVLIYAGWASLGAACAIGMANRSAGAAGAAAAITVGGSVALWLFVCHQEKRMAELHGSSQRVP